MSLLAQLKAMASPPEARPVYPHLASPVSDSDDLERILALPRRPIPSEEEQRNYAQEMTQKLRWHRTPQDGPCRCAELRPEVVKAGQNPCITELRPVQGWYLYEASIAAISPEPVGVAGFIAISAGKTGIDILTPMVFPGCRKAVLLISPTAVDQFLKDFEVWSQHFETPQLVGSSTFKPGRVRLEIFKYSQMSQKKNFDWLRQRPDIDLFVGDEIQALKDRNSARTGRFLRFMSENERIRVCEHSASFTSRGIEDCAHLIGLALREGSPTPLDMDVVDKWAEHINPSNGLTFLTNPGKLLRLCEKGEGLRTAVHRRIMETPGVISTKDSGVAAKLVFKEADAGPVPKSVLDALAQVRREEKRPDGQDLLDQLEVAQVCAEVSCGFYHRWRFPHGEPEALIEEWFERRAAWAAEVRSKLKHRVDGLDSPGLLKDAAIRWEDGYRGPLPTWRSGTWKGWAEIEPQVRPVPDFVWIDDFLARACAKWALANPGIVWYHYRAFGLKVEELTGLRRFGEGRKASAEILEQTGEKSIIASIMAHHKEKNLQFAFWRNLVANPPADGGITEQMLGRTHRAYQPHDTVEAWYFRHTPEVRKTWEKSREYAGYIQGLTGNPQKLLYGAVEWEQVGKRKP